MPEIKNTFLRSKMNKDLDSRIIPNGEYRNAENISISTSEGSDVGALENIRGNVNISDFGLTDPNLKVIGSCVDETNNRIFFFITNHVCVASDFSSSSGEEQVTISTEDGGTLTNTFNKIGSKHYIVLAKLNNSSIDTNSSSVDTTILVSGDFLNFSTLSPIYSSDIIEDLLFWTDNRNQPRKINVKRAKSNPYIPNEQAGYYTSEDHVSVSKYAPYASISFLEELITKGPWLKDLEENEVDLKRTTLKNEVDEYLPAHIVAPGSISSNKITINSNIGKIKDASGLESDAGISDFLFNLDSNSVFSSNVNIKVTCKEFSGEAFLASIDGDEITLKTANQSVISNINNTLGWSGNVTVKFQSANPDYVKNFVGDKNFLKEKFIRFSYRFKYDDGEYSLIAPFSQHAFIPKQYGHFIGDDTEKTAESSIVDFMENQVTTAGLIIDLPCPPNKLKEKLHVEEIQLLYKASDEQSIKVIADIIPDNQGVPEQVLIHSNGDTGYNESIEDNNQHDFTPVSYENESTGTGEGMKIAVIVNSDGTISTISKNEFIGFCVSSPGHGYRIGDILTVRNPETPNAAGAKIRIEKLSNKYYYNYKSQKPIKVLPEKEIVRVSDIVPIRAKTQESVGNRIVYGNFLQNNKTPNSLRYKVGESIKGIDTSLRLNEELINHSLKQNRTYQVGIVLQDRYGRSSNVIINNDTSSSTSFTSTYFSPYTNGGLDPLSWPGNSLNIIFSEKIPTQKTNDYNGVWSETNPLGWYSYKVVIKQQEQDYYNVYVPGSLSGNVVFTGYNKGDGNDQEVTPLTYNGDDKVSHIVLFNDNINKIPRDLNKVGPSDKVYSSNVILHSRVNNKTSTVSSVSTDLSQQTSIPGSQTVTNIRPFSEMGDWTKYKNVDLHYLNMNPSTGASQYLINTFIYPGVKGDVNPLYLENNKNPLIATLKTDQRIGYTSSEQGGSDNNSFKFSKFLTIFETQPVKSEIDIYYETSSSGTIEEFNKRVDDVLPEDPEQIGVKIENISEIKNISWSEDQDVGDYVSNPFQALDINNNPISDSSIIIEVVDCVKYSEVSGDVGGGFSTNIIDVVEDTPSQGDFIQAKFVLAVGLKRAYPFDNDDEFHGVRLTLRATSSFSEPFQTVVDVPLGNKDPFIHKMIAYVNSGSSGFYSQGSELFNFNTLLNNQLGFKRAGNSDSGAPLNNDTYINGFKRRKQGATNSEDFYIKGANAKIVNVYSQDSFNNELAGFGKVPVGIFDITSNGSVTSISSSAQTDKQLRESGVTNNGQDRLRGINSYYGNSYPSISSESGFYLGYSGFEVRTCRFNNENGQGWVNLIGQYDDDNDFDEKFFPAAPFAIEKNSSSGFYSNRYIVYYTGGELVGGDLVTNGAFAFGDGAIQSEYNNSGDKRAAILMTFAFSIVDNDGNGLPSKKYIARTLIYKGPDGPI